jgi:hypothetical protein
MGLAVAHGMRLHAALLLLTTTSFAQAEVLARDEATQREAEGPPQVDLGLTVGGGVGPDAGYAFAGLDAGYRLMPQLALGGYAAKTLATFAMSDESCGGSACPGFSRLGARAELHLVPGFPIDPWVALGGGARFIEAATRAELLVSAGLDVRPLRELAIGAFVTLSPSSDSGPRGGTTDVGLRVSVSFDATTRRESALRTDGVSAF